MKYWVVKLTESGVIDDIESFPTHGLATQKTHELSDAGFASRIVPPELEKDVLYLFNQVKQKRENGFIPEYGIVPNGTRSKGDGARGVGRMIFPAFGGMLEGSDTVHESADGPESDSSANSTAGQRSPLTFSSKSSGNSSQKIQSVLDKLNGLSERHKD